MENGEINLIELAQHFSDEDAAREYVEKLRWPDGPSARTVARSITPIA